MEGKCKDCHYCVGMYDEHFGCLRWGCVTLGRMVSKDVAQCRVFEPRVPQTSYLPTASAYPRLLDKMLVENLRFHMLQVENLLRALEREQIPPQRKGLVD